MNNLELKANIQVTHNFELSKFQKQVKDCFDNHETKRLYVQSNSRNIGKTTLCQLLALESFIKYGNGYGYDVLVVTSNHSLSELFEKWVNSQTGVYDNLSENSYKHSEIYICNVNDLKESYGHHYDLVIMDLNDKQLTESELNFIQACTLDRKGKILIFSDNDENNIFKNYTKI